MKKRILYFLVLLICIVGIFIGFYSFSSHKSNENTKVTVAEVAHSAFYAPQYLALSLGYFEEEGLDVDIVLSNGADAVMAAVLSNDADIGFCGTEATI